MDCFSSNRRDFIKSSMTIIGFGLLASSASTLLSSCEKSENTTNNPPSKITLNLSDYPELTQVNSFAFPIIPGKNAGMPIIIIRNTETEFIVLTSKCSHQGCQVGKPDMTNKSITCPCHGSKYNLQGGIINGPTTSPLKKFNSTYNSANNTLEIEI